MDVRTGFHVLAVDDTATDRLIIEKFLKKSSFHVTAVDSGIKALELLGLDDADSENHHHQEIDMIITDYCMPGLTGYELLMKVKGSKNLKDIPVVIMSSEQIPSRINMCLEGGAEEFFVKPVKQHHVEMLKPHLLKSKAKDPPKALEDINQLVN